MTAPKLASDLVTRPSVVERLRVVCQPITRWARSETGGWMIVIGLAVLALAVAAAAVVLPRLNSAPSVAPPATTGEPGSIQTQIGDLVDFTLAPETIQDIGAEAARAWNAALPFSTDPVRPAAPFFAPAADVESYGRALDCLTTAIYYEAASESAAGQAAVAQVVLNRARHPAYPRTVCGVVFQGSERATGCQFSFTCDGAMARVPSRSGWDRARAVATAALNGHVVAAVGTATHYHTDWVAPYWAPRLSKVVQIGTHIFYRWNGAWGLPSAFTGVYRGAEPVVVKMTDLATIAFDTPVEVLDAAAAAPVDLALTPVSLTPRVDIPYPEDGVEPVGAVPTPADTPLAVVEVERPAAQPPREPPAIMADPLARPDQARSRARPRIAAPAGW